MHASLKTLVLLIVAVVFAVLMIEMRSAFGL
jgi:hypothetical protein